VNDAQPWTAPDAVAVVATQAVGVVAIVIGWYEAGGQRSAGRQMAWVATAVAGLVVAAVGNAAWLGRARRRIGQRSAWARLALIDTRPAVVADDRVLIVPGARRFHTPECLLVDGKATVAMTIEEARAAGRESCGVCGV
jgi:hypothetical protein